MEHRPDPIAEELRSHLGWIRALARHLVGDSSSADELAQDACVTAISTRPRSLTRPRAWLGRVVRNLAKERARSNRNRRTREEFVSRSERTDSTAEVIIRSAQQRALVEAVFGLGETYRTTILMRFFEDLPPREIAHRMEVPVSTVKTRIERGLSQLRSTLVQTSKDRDNWLPVAYPTVGRSGVGTWILSGLSLLEVPPIAIASALVLGWTIWLGISDGAPDSEATEALQDSLAAQAGAIGGPEAASILGLDTDGMAERHERVIQLAAPTGQGTLTLRLHLVPDQGLPDAAPARVRVSGLTETGSWPSDLHLDFGVNIGQEVDLDVTPLTRPRFINLGLETLVIEVDCLEYLDVRHVLPCPLECTRESIASGLSSIALATVPLERCARVEFDVRSTGGVDPTQVVTGFVENHGGQYLSADPVSVLGSRAVIELPIGSRGLFLALAPGYVPFFADLDVTRPEVFRFSTADLSEGYEITGRVNSSTPRELLEPYGVTVSSFRPGERGVHLRLGAHDLLKTDELVEYARRSTSLGPNGGFRVGELSSRVNFARVGARRPWGEAFVKSHGIAVEPPASGVELTVGASATTIELRTPDGSTLRGSAALHRLHDGRRTDSCYLQIHRENRFQFLLPGGSEFELEITSEGRQKSTKYRFVTESAPNPTSVEFDCPSLALDGVLQFRLHGLPAESVHMTAAILDVKGGQWLGYRAVRLERSADHVYTLGELPLIPIEVHFLYYQPLDMPFRPLIYCDALRSIPSPSDGDSVEHDLHFSPGGRVLIRTLDKEGKRTQAKIEVLGATGNGPCPLFGHISELGKFLPGMQGHTSDDFDSLLLEALPPGEYRIRATRPNHQPSEQAFEISANETTEVELFLSRD